MAKKKRKYKYVRGTERVDIPPVRDEWDVANQVLNTTATGAEVGMKFGGPQGAAIGAGIGLVGGGIASLAQRRSEMLRGRRAESTNKFFEEHEREQDPKLQAFQSQAFINQKGNKGLRKYKTIEIEGKDSPEIHTDKNFNIKNFGKQSHEHGGTIVNASAGDIVFDTQNSDTDFEEVMGDIRRYKLNGDQEAHRRLEKRRKEMPEDTGEQKQEGDPGLEPFYYQGDQLVNAGELGYSGEFESAPLDEGGNRLPGIYLDPSGLPIDERGDPVSTELQQRPVNENTALAQQIREFSDDESPESIYNFLRTNSGAKDPAELRKAIKESGLDHNDVMDMLDNIVGDGTKGSATSEPGSKTLGRGNNNILDIGPETFNSFQEVNQRIGENEAAYSKQFDQVEPIDVRQFSPGEFQGGAETSLESPDEEVGQAEIDADQTVGREGSRFQATDAIRYANIGRNLIKSFQKLQAPEQRKLDLGRYEYQDFSEPLRQAALRQQKVQQGNIGRVGSSRGQQLSYQAQAGSQYLNRIGQIENAEIARKYGVQQANVGLGAREKMFNMQDSIRRENLMRQSLAQRSDFGGAATQELVGLYETQRLEGGLKGRERKQEAMDQRILESGLLGTPNFPGVRPNFDPIFQRTPGIIPEQEQTPLKRKGTKSVRPYKYKSGTKRKK